MWHSIKNSSLNKSTLVFSLLICLFTSPTIGQNYSISGQVTNPYFLPIPNARIEVVIGTGEGDTLVAFSDESGLYHLPLVSGKVFSNTGGNDYLLQNFPNPFSTLTAIPYKVPVTSPVRIAIYNLQGRLIKVLCDSIANPGDYFTSWDGTNMQNSKQKQGIYLALLTTSGLSEAIRIFYDPEGWHELPAPLPGNPANPGAASLPGFTIDKMIVSAQNYTTLILEQVKITEPQQEINFQLEALSQTPFKVDHQFFYVNKNGQFEKILIKGINIGVGMPGLTPGDLMKVTKEDYLQWLYDAEDVGFNTIRIYTLQGPQFYEALAGFNASRPENPLYVFHGIWLDEEISPDLYNSTEVFQSGIIEVVDCVHGNRFGVDSIPSRPGRGYGEYRADISDWVIGYLIGREVFATEVIGTNEAHPVETSYSGTILSIQNAQPAEVWITWQMEYCLNYELRHYHSIRPIGFSSWATLDPITHPTNTTRADDLADIELNKLDDSGTDAGVFVSYHAYPYYPDFISNDPGYQTYSDEFGSNSYLGYLHDLKAQYPNKALLIAEYGVPSSWGDARKASNGMDHGGHDETSQGIYLVRLLHNIFDAQCAGGIAFAQIDEWFKRSWITEKIETYTYTAGTGYEIISRALWHNLTNPEQNFGLITYDPVPQPLQPISLTSNALHMNSVKALADAQYFTMELEFNASVPTGETLYLALDTYDSELGESHLKDGTRINNRAEFLLEMKMNQSANLLVTEAYDLCGNTSIFVYRNDQQVFHSIPSDGKPWVLERWINDQYKTYFDIGELHTRTSDETPESNDAVTFAGSSIQIRIPWTMLYFMDPTRKAVVHFEGTQEFRISDGIALTISRNGAIAETARYSWDPWTETPVTQARKKASYYIMQEALKNW